MIIRRIALVASLTAVSLVPALARGAALQTSQTNSGTKPTPEHLAADTPKVTPGGATFTVPTGWAVTNGKGLVVLEPPETDTHIAIVDSQGADAAAAVAAAWAAYKPDFKRPLRLATPRPAREGWEEQQVFSYETSPGLWLSWTEASRRLRNAARRSASSWKACAPRATTGSHSPDARHNRSMQPTSANSRRSLRTP